MNPIACALSDHHAHCDELFALAEAKAGAGRWTEALEAFGAFRRELESHLRGEENVLFPAFEAATGARCGPTEVMRQEHQRMRALLEQIALALTGHDADRVDDYASTLLILMQQHNLKEESMLYPMCDAALGERAPEIISGLQLGGAATCPP